MKEIEEGKTLTLEWEKLAKVAAAGKGLIPVIVQDIITKDILLLAYADEKALKTTLSTGEATFWSTSRNELWIKGKTSGDSLAIQEIRVNCEQNSLLYLVKMKTGGSCHTRNKEGKSRRTCYYRKVNSDQTLDFVE